MTQDKEKSLSNVNDQSTRVKADSISVGEKEFDAFLEKVLDQLTLGHVETAASMVRSAAKDNSQDKEQPAEDKNVQTPQSDEELESSLGNMAKKIKSSGKSAYKDLKKQLRATVVFMRNERNRDEHKLEKLLVKGGLSKKQADKISDKVMQKHAAGLTDSQIKKLANKIISKLKSQQSFLGSVISGQNISPSITPQNARNTNQNQLG